MVLGKQYARYERSQKAHQRLFEKHLNGRTNKDKVKALYHASVRTRQRIDGMRVLGRSEKKAVYRDAKKRVAAGKYPFK